MTFCLSTCLSQLRFDATLYSKLGNENSDAGRRFSTPALQHGKFLNGNVSVPNVTPVLILRRYMLFGFVTAKMGIGVKDLERLQAEFEPAYKYSRAQLGTVKSACQVPLTITSVPFTHFRTACWCR